MTSPLLDTTLFAPKPRRGLVSRPSLIERLAGGTESRLTLISAPWAMSRGNLDSTRAREVLGLLGTLNGERGQTVLLVTQDAEVGAACDRIIRMRDGWIVADERVSEVSAAA